MVRLSVAAVVTCAVAALAVPTYGDGPKKSMNSMGRGSRNSVQSNSSGISPSRVNKSISSPSRVKKLNSSPSSSLGNFGSPTRGKGSSSSRPVVSRARSAASEEDESGGSDLTGGDSAGGPSDDLTGDPTGDPTDDLTGSPTGDPTDDSTGGGGSDPFSPTTSARPLPTEPIGSNPPGDGPGASSGATICDMTVTAEQMNGLEETAKKQLKEVLEPAGKMAGMKPNCPIYKQQAQQMLGMKKGGNSTDSGGLPPPTATTGPTLPTTTPFDGGDDEDSPSSPPGGDEESPSLPPGGSDDDGGLGGSDYSGSQLPDPESEPDPGAESEGSQASGSGFGRLMESKESKKTATRKKKANASHVARKAMASTKYGTSRKPKMRRSTTSPEGSTINRLNRNMGLRAD
ncbi:hypothetical protein XA68_18343 [Ophiocordyceps unilateralis]|uniref:Uncharacterized protein n=1 Tax=Ophiocordyceps unilateralis TaxID=268505 RepID=A0A2A9P2M6_OPHUN|nr:hypothetical protein XA68_18343 [Ophiocordyceps unilateralis]